MSPCGLNILYHQIDRIKMPSAAVYCSVVERVRVFSRWRKGKQGRLNLGVYTKSALNKLQPKWYSYKLHSTKGLKRNATTCHRVLNPRAKPSLRLKVGQRTLSNQMWWFSKGDSGSLIEKPNNSKRIKSHII